MPNFDVTTKEKAMIRAFLLEGINVNGAEEPAHLIEDNMTWMNADDLVQDLGWSKQEVGGVMSSLELKGIICNSGESPRGARIPDWSLEYDAIEPFWYLTEKE